MDNNGALFSQDQKHRISLWRIWDDTKPLIMFIGLNPSKADANIDDPTIRKVKKIAKYLGYGGVYMMNLFTFISTDPDLLNKEYGNVDGSDNHLFAIGNKCNKIVFAWGNFDVKGRDKIVMAMFPIRYALHINKNGSPKHPLYCKDRTIPTKY